MPNERDVKMALSTPSKMERLETENNNLENLLRIAKDKIIELEKGLITLNKEIYNLKGRLEMNKRHFITLQNKEKELEAKNTALTQVILKDIKGAR